MISISVNAQKQVRRATHTVPGLMKGVNHVDAVTFQTQVMSLEKLMYHVSFTMLRNNDDCDDAVQEALIRAWKKRADLSSIDRFRPWLMRILVNQCNDMLKKRNKKVSFH